MTIARPSSPSNLPDELTLDDSAAPAPSGSDLPIPPNPSVPAESASEDPVPTKAPIPGYPNTAGRTGVAALMMVVLVAAAVVVV